MTPALTSSSLKLPMAASISLLGSAPASLFFVALMMTMTRIANLLGYVACTRQAVWGFCKGDERRLAGSTRAAQFLVDRCFVVALRGCTWGCAPQAIARMTASDNRNRRT